MFTANTAPPRGAVRSRFYFQVTLSNPGGGSLLGSQTTANVHIVDVAYSRPPGSSARHTFRYSSTFCAGLFWWMIAESSARSCPPGSSSW